LGDHMKTCNVEDCPRRHYGLGYCRPHYRSFKNHGDPLWKKPASLTSCTVAGCDRSHVARGLCSAHYQKLRATGEATTDRRRKRNVCRVDGCGLPAHGHGLCRNHWNTNRNHGDPLYVRPTYDVCRIEGCGNSPRSPASQWCEMHYYRNRRHGDPTHVEDTRQETVLYRAAHQRVWSEKGRARDQECAACFSVAAHWAYDHTDPDEMTDERTGCVYSLDTSKYKPLCQPCHALLDREHGRVGNNQYSGATSV